MRTFPYDEKKLGELMVYVASKCERHERFGAVKLNKVLFYADFVAYTWRGKPITGAEYRRLQFSPAPVRLLAIERALTSTNAVVKRATVAPGGHQENRLIPLRTADLSLFEAEEIAIVDQVVEALKDHTAKDVSECSHRFPGWGFAGDNEVIPYFTALLPEAVGPLSIRDTKWVNGVISQFVRSCRTCRA